MLLFSLFQTILSDYNRYETWRFYNLKFEINIIKDKKTNFNDGF